ncbi:hypothetical protein ACNYS0_20110 [Streptomyces sp. BH034]|uniref:hypothetical protein n=1 Tax=Streptomyces sp. BH034 TaxID=3402626 RepID=UPI003BB4D78D
MSQTPEQPETRLAAVDGRDALAYVVIRPAGETPDGDRITVEAGAHGMSKAAAAYALRQTADEFDRAAVAEGDTPITPEEAAAEQAARPARPDGLDALLDHVAAGLAVEEQQTAAPAEAVRLARHARELATMLRTEQGEHGSPSYDHETGPGMGKAAGILDAYADVLDDGTQPRRVLDEDEYHELYLAARRTLGNSRAYRAGTETITDTIDATLAAVGILPPPPAPDDETCPAMFPDPDGAWWQCAEEPGHDTTDGHDAGDWAWPADSPEAIAPQARP